MKTIFIQTALLFILASCNSVKHIYSEESISDRQFEKLVKNYLKDPADSSNANKLVYAYEFLLGDRQINIENLKHSNDIRSKEKLIAAYDDLQSFYTTAGTHPMLRQLLHPGNVAAEREAALQDAANSWYNYATNLMDANTWQNGREAFRVLNKVNGWIFNYRDTRNLVADAREMGTINAVLQPLRSEGFFYSSGFVQTGYRFSNQLLNDLAAFSANDMYRIYAGNDSWYPQTRPDWIIEPVITRMKIDPLQYHKSSRTVTKQIEVGKDSAKVPVYKTISAVLHITEARVNAYAEMEARISDHATNGMVDRRRFSDGFSIAEVSATFTGDKNALSPEDWQLVNNRNNINVDERWLREKVLEKIYPSILNYLRTQLRHAV